MCSRCLIENGMDGLFADSHDNVMLRSVLGCGDVCRANALFYFYPKSNTARLIYKMKYGSRWDAGIFMGNHAARVLLPQGFFDGVDVIVPVPLTHRRFVQRGFNQSEMLAEGISEITGIAVDKKSLQRQVFTESQTRLRGEQRIANVADAFILKDDASLGGKHILLVDDVFTTGATLRACIREISGKTYNTKFSILTLGLTKT